MKPGRIEALIKVRNFPELAPFRELLDDEISTATQTLVSAQDDRQMVLAQGAARALRRLKDLIEGSQDVLDKARVAGAPRPAAFL